MLDQAIAHGGGVVDAAQVRDMLGLADRSRVLELFEKTMRGDAPAVVAALGEMHDAGADPVVVLQDLLELTHWVTRLKVAPDAARGLGRQRARPGPGHGGQALDGVADAGLADAAEGPAGDAGGALAAARGRDGADPAVLRRRPALARPTPSRRCRTARRRPPAAAVAGARAARRWRRRRGGPSRDPAGRRHGAAQPARGALPNPKSFTEIVALFEARREARLVHHLMHHVHEVRCEPGLIEFRPAAQGAARPGAAAQRALEPMDRPALDRLGVVAPRASRRSTSRRRPRRDELRSQAENNPLVQAILKTFPGAKLDAVRRKGEQTSLVAGLAEAGEEPPPAEEYPADDDIPESEY